MCDLLARDQRRKLARQTNDILTWAAYRNFKREVKREVRLAEHDYVTTQIMGNPNDKRYIWKTIQSCIPRRIVPRESYSKDDKTIANEFNGYFTSLGQAALEKIKLLSNQCNYDLLQAPFMPREYPASEQFTFKPVDSDDIQNIINSMPTNKAPGHDKISVRVIKDSLPVILPSITSIFNTSLLTGQFPRAWKKAEVVTVPKDGDREQAENNRPISLLPVLLKVCERPH